MLCQVPGNLKNSYSVDMCVEEEDQARYDADILNNINPSGLPPHHLQLKKGAVIILIRNLSVKFGHCNGTRYIVQDISNRLIHARKLNRGVNDIIIIPKIKLCSKDTDFHAVFSRKQFPVMLAFYLTFH